MPAAEIYKIADAANPTMEMLKGIGDLSSFKLSGGKVLVWVYVAPNKSKGGIYLTDKEVNESIWQGAVGYVLATGPFAFEDDPALNIRFGGFSASPGQWVTFVPGEGKRIQINGVDCKVFEDSLIQMVIPDPTLITHRR